MDLRSVPIREGGQFWSEICSLALEAFPPEEYLAPEKLLKMARENDFDFLALCEGDELVGFTAIQHSDEFVYLFFLAIVPNKRGRGYGSRALELIHGLYSEKEHIVDFEMPDKDAANAEQRLRRREFYLRGGYWETGIFMHYLGVDYEVMCSSGELDEEKFRRFMGHIRVDGFNPTYFRK